MMFRPLIALLLIVSSASYAETVEEPSDYRGDPYNAPVPETLKGATVLNDEAAYKVWQDGIAFVDVYPYAPKPANLPKGTIWHEQAHQSIKGATWLPNVGYQALAPETMQYFEDGLTTVTKSDKDAPVVFFCLADCWMSWNSAKRAMEMGYTHVSWYPEGTDGWDFMDYPIEDLKPWVKP